MQSLEMHCVYAIRYFFSSRHFTCKWDSLFWFVHAQSRFNIIIPMVKSTESLYIRKLLHCCLIILETWSEIQTVYVKQLDVTWSFHTCSCYRSKCFLRLRFIHMNVTLNMHIYIIWPLKIYLSHGIYSVNDKESRFYSYCIQHFIIQCSIIINVADVSIFLL